MILRGSNQLRSSENFLFNLLLLLIDYSLCKVIQINKQILKKGLGSQNLISINNNYMYVRLLFFKQKLVTRL